MLLQLLNAREKVFRPQWEFFFSKKIPSLACRFFAAEKVAGFDFWIANLPRRSAVAFLTRGLSQ
jgi:hypothetical protein